MRPENIEVIMKIDFGASDGKQICAHAERVQELVRCGECKHWDEESTFCLNIEGCYGNETTPNWFCADGERKGEEE